MYPPPPPRVPLTYELVPPRPGHDSWCEVGRGTILEECQCGSRTYYRQLHRDEVVAVEVPWGLFAFERGRPDTRGHDEA